MKREQVVVERYGKLRAYLAYQVDEINIYCVWRKLGLECVQGVLCCESV